MTIQCCPLLSDTMTTLEEFNSDTLQTQRRVALENAYEQQVGRNQRFLAPINKQQL